MEARGSAGALQRLVEVLELVEVFELVEMPGSGLRVEGLGSEGQDLARLEAGGDVDGLLDDGVRVRRSNVLDRHTCTLG